MKRLLVVLMAGLAAAAPACGRTAARPVEPPPPAAAPPPQSPVMPYVPTHHTLRVCVLQDGALRMVDVGYNVRTGDSTIAGRPFPEVHPSTAPYAAGEAWLIHDEPIRWRGHLLVKYGPERTLRFVDVVLGGEHRGVPVFGEAGAASEVIYIPVRTGCVFQPYQVDYTVGAVRG
jgi:hypothetical protein